jgi:hypothetical protein
MARRARHNGQRKGATKHFHLLLFEPFVRGGLQTCWTLLRPAIWSNQRNTLERVQNFNPRNGLRREREEELGRTRMFSWQGAARHAGPGEDNSLGERVNSEPG